MSTLRVNTLQDAAGSGQPAMAGAAKAWVNFNGTGTVSIRAAFNVSSITDNGVGDYTVNFTTAMPDANYALTAAAAGVNGVNFTPSVGLHSIIAPTNLAARIQADGSNGTVTTVRDSSNISVAVFR